MFLSNKHWGFCYRKHRLIYTYYLFLYLADYENILFGYGLTFLTLFSLRTHLGNLAPVLLLCEASIHCVQDFDLINIRFQLFHCELSSRVAALTSDCLCNPTPLAYLSRLHSSLSFLSAHYAHFMCWPLLSIALPCSSSHVLIFTSPRHNNSCDCCSSLRR